MAAPISISEQTRADLRNLVALVSVFNLGLLLSAALVRELPCFWTNAGGVPVLLRAAHPVEPPSPTGPTPGPVRQ